MLLDPADVDARASASTRCCRALPAGARRARDAPRPTARRSSSPPSRTRTVAAAIARARAAARAGSPRTLARAAGSRSPRRARTRSRVWAETSRSRPARRHQVIHALDARAGAPRADLRAARPRRRARRRARVRALNRLRAHLPLLLALSANSPFWQGRDTRPGLGAHAGLPGASRAPASRAASTLRGLRADGRPAHPLRARSPSRRSCGGTCARSRARHGRDPRSWTRRPLARHGRARRARAVRWSRLEAREGFAPRGARRRRGGARGEPLPRGPRRHARPTSSTRVAELPPPGAEQLRRLLDACARTPTRSGAGPSSSGSSGSRSRRRSCTSSTSPARRRRPPRPD